MKRKLLCSALVLLSLLALLSAPVAAVWEDPMPVSRETSGQHSVPTAAGFDFSFSIYGTENYDAANSVLAYVNEYRAAAGAAPLKMDPQLTAHAMQRAAELAVFYSSDHLRPDGTKWYTVLEGVFHNRAAGENIAWGYSSASAVSSAWYNSAGHYANMVNTNYISIGIGCFYQPGGQLCWVQLFSSQTTGKSYSGSGTVYKPAVPITMNTDCLQLNVSPSNSGTVTIYEGQTQTLDVSIGSFGGKMTEDSYYFTSGDPSIATVDNSARSIRGIRTGSTGLYLHIGNLQASMTVNVSPRLVLWYEKDEYGRPILNWDDASGEAILFLKEEEHLYWSQAYPNNGPCSYNHTSIRMGDWYTYVLRVRSGDGYMDISNTVSIYYGIPETPVVKIENVPATGKIRLSWDAVKGAEEYVIYRRAGADGSYVKLRSTADTTYDNVSITPGVKYYYRIKAVSGYDVASDYSATVAATCDLARPVVTASNVASTGKIKLTWKAIDGATGYEVYRATSKDGTYHLLNTVTSTSYTNKSAQAGKTYYYKVRAVCDVAAAKSAYSAVDTITCDLARPVVTASNVASTGKVKLTWKAIDGATGYEVYRATSKDGTYHLLNTVTSTSYINKSAQAGKTYYYKVRAVCDVAAAKSAYSAVDTITCDLARPNVAAALKNGKPYLGWDAVEGATGYEIYRATAKDGPYTKLNTVTGTVYHNVSATGGTTYYYRVRAVCGVSAAASAYDTDAIKVP